MKIITYVYFRVFKLPLNYNFKSGNDKNCELITELFLNKHNIKQYTLP